MRYLILLSLLSASACFDTHQSGANVVIGGRGKAIKVETSVDNGEFKVSLPAAKLLLFEVNERLLFSRLVYEKGGKVYLVKPNSLTIAGGEIGTSKTYENAEDANFIKACIGLESSGETNDDKQYSLVVDVNENDQFFNENDQFFTAKCKLADDSSELVLPVSLLVSRANKLPEGYNFDAGNIKKTNLNTVMNNAYLCQSKSDDYDLTFDSSNYTCTCSPGHTTLGGAPGMGGLLNAFDNNPNCEEDNKTAYLLKPLAEEDMAGNANPLPEGQ